ncbi:MAG: SDR family NAD(P)-dependent oxidoreductase [Pseudomonadales bacterium]|nr:SDR family NAD(P)-dependent oxidoreductase [Pseudomonadales bacterium]
MDLLLKGKKAIVTGATRGIGLRIARQLAQEGMDLAICARTQAAVSATCRELQDEYGVQVLGRAVDVMKGADLRQWIAQAATELGGLDVFVSNVTGGPSTAGEEGWQACFDGDIMGAVRGCEASLPFLRRQGGAIVLIASISGVMAKALKAPGIYAYGSAKAAVIAYGAQLSKDVAKDGIRVNCVSPGPIYFEGGAWDMIKQHAPQVYQEALDECVIGRLGTPEDIAAAVAFLASPVSGFTTSQNLHVDGGYMMHIPY